MNKPLFIVILISLINLALAFLSGYLGWSFQFAIIGLLFLFSGMILLNRKHSKNNNLLRVAILVFPFLLCYGVPIFSKNLTHLYPILAISFVSVIIAWTVRIRLHNAIMTCIIYTVFILASGILGMPNWLNYKLDKNTADTFAFPKFPIVDLDGNTFHFEKGKIYVVDLWSLICSVCIKKFPEFEELHKNYLDDSSVELLTLCLPIKGRQYNNQFTEKYSFKKLYTTKINSWEELGIREIPKYLVINANSEIVYMGGLNAKWYHFYNNINSIIKDEKSKQVQFSAFNN